WGVEAASQTHKPSSSNSGKIHCRLTVRKPERGKGQCLLCRRHPGRDSNALVENRRPKGHLPHLDPALQTRAGKLARNCKATWSCPYPGRERAKKRRRRAGKRATNQGSK